MDNLFNRVTDALITGVMRLRWLVLGLIALTTLLAAWQASRVQFDSSVEAWFVDHDPTMVSYREFLKRFGQDEVVIMGLFTKDVYQPEFLAGLQKFTAAVETLPHVRSATSLANARVLSGGEEGTSMEPLITTAPTNAAESAALRQKVESGPPLVRGLVGDKGAATAVIVTLEDSCRGTDAQGELVAAVRALQNQLPPNSTMRIAGTPVVNVGMFQYAERDLRVLVPVALLLVFVTTYFLYRRFRASLVPIFNVGIAIIWVFAIMALLGWKTNILHAAMVLVLIVCGVANSIHILAAYFRELEHGHDRETAAVRAVGEIMRAALFANLTTVVGFLSLLNTDLEPIRQYGVLAALGSVFAFLLSVIGVPPLLPFVRPPKHATHSDDEHTWYVKIVHLLARPSRQSSIKVVIATG
ncbi:MAG: MMPL family transporter, partial [Planctomycetaceae bacterium]|nr:MMPL family transporter [Planctomycetaceae bacterium]